MRIRARLLADVAILVFALVFVAYMVSLALFIGAHLLGREASVVPVAVTLGAFWLCTIVAWVIAFPHLNRSSSTNKALWAIGFVLAGALVIPPYYSTFMRRSLRLHQSSVSIRFADIAVFAYLCLSMVMFAWTISWAFARSNITLGYQIVSGSQTVTTFIFLACAAVTLLRRNWPLSRKLIWALALVIGSFVTLPVFYGLHMRVTEEISSSGASTL